MAPKITQNKTFAQDHILAWRVTSSGRILFGKVVPFTGNTYKVIISGVLIADSYEVHVMRSDGKALVARSQVTDSGEDSVACTIAFTSEDLRNEFEHLPHERRSFHTYIYRLTQGEPSETVAEGDLELEWSPLWQELEKGPAFSMRGPQGPQGQQGEKGDEGASAYEIAVRNGFIGSQSDWLDSLNGKPSIMSLVQFKDENGNETQDYYTISCQKDDDQNVVLSLDQTATTATARETPFVTLSGSQNITGQKTFTTSPIVPTLNVGNSTQAVASTACVDAKVASALENLKQSAQHISGSWTFENNPSYEKTQPSESTTDVNVATVGWVNDTQYALNVVHRADDETITGSKTFTGSLTILGNTTIENVTHTPITMGTPPTVFTSNAPVSIRMLGELLFQYMPYFDGSWRIFTEEIIPDNFKGNESTPNSKQVYSQYPFIDRTGGIVKYSQVGIFAPFATKVGSFAFYGIDWLSRLSLPVCKEIDTSAFAECEELTEISLPLCRKVGMKSFYKCGRNTNPYALTKLDFLPLCEEVGERAFELCDYITEINLPRLRSAGSVAFAQTGLGTNNKNGYKLAKISVGTDYDLTDPNTFGNDKRAMGGEDERNTLGEKLVGRNATNPTDVLKELIAPNIQVIQTEAFASCDKLTKITIPSVEEICARAFLWCGRDFSGNTNYIAPQLDIRKCHTIGENAFGRPESSYNNDWGATVAYRFRCDALTSLGRCAFHNVNKLTHIYAPLLTQIPYKAFDTCKELIGSQYYDDEGMVQGNPGVVSFPLVTSIGDWAFSNCVKMTALNIPLCTSIMANALMNTNALTDVYLTGMSIDDIANMPNFPFNAKNNNILFHGGDGTISKTKVKHYA